MRKLISLSFLLGIFLCSSMIVYGEGSRDLVENGGNRPYIEYNQSAFWNTGNGNLMRQQEVKAYVKAGETVYFGSSVASSSNSNGDILVSHPSGTITYYDVIEDGEGYIPDETREAAGPKEINEEGYEALSFTASEEGIYSFKFFPGNSGSVIAGTSWNKNQGSATIAAFDVSVANESGQLCEGRTFVNYLSASVAGTSRGECLESVIYVLTDDGYIYKTDFNGMEPYVFLCFASKRGLVNSVTNTSLYHSALNSSSGELPGKVTFASPDKDSASVEDKTYKLFFNYPGEDTLEYLGVSSPESTPVITDFVFNENKTALTGAGGEFSFTASKEGTYQIELVFDDGKKLYLSNTCVKGKNSISWDGKDKEGDIVKEGSYKATITPKSGEYHFPMIDIENNTNGLKITLENSPSGEKSSTIYYDNSNVTVNESDFVFTTKDDNTAYNFTGSLTQLEGIDSSEGALKFNDNFGNEKILDIWTYYTDKSKEKEASLEIKDTLDEEPVEEGKVNVSISSNKSRLSAGEFITYTINVTNEDNSRLEGVRLRDYMIYGVSFRQINDSIGKYGVINGREHATWFIESLEAGESKELSVTVKVNECLPKNFSLYNMVYYEVTGSKDAPYNNIERDPENHTEILHTHFMTN